MRHEDAAESRDEAIESTQTQAAHLGELVASVVDTPAKAAHRIRKGVRAFIDAVAEPTEPDEGQESSTLSLEDDGEDIGAKLALLASGGAKVADLGPGYFRAPDGTIGVRTDVSAGGSIVGLGEEFWQGGQPADR